jgi:hypothetical protein
MRAGTVSMPNPRGTNTIVGNAGNGYAKIQLLQIVDTVVAVNPGVACSFTCLNGFIWNGINCVDPNAFITTWKITSAGEKITIPTNGAGYNFSVAWGDGTATVYNGTAPTVTHTYAASGNYDVYIR